MTDFRPYLVADDTIALASEDIGRNYARSVAHLCQIGRDSPYWDTIYDQEGAVMKWNEMVERADEILLARQLNAYMGVEDEEPTRLASDERAPQYGDIEDDDERQLAEALDRLTGVEHEPRRPRVRRDYSGLQGAEEIILAMEWDEQYGKPEVTR